MRYQLQENCLTIFLPKEIDHHNAEDMRETADSIIKNQHVKYIIFDFDKTDFMDSSGIGVIMGRYRTIHYLGGEIWAVHTNERMKKILTMSGMTNILQIYEEDTL
ncbi:MAG: anti-sigma factor antagonist [Hespellia sp.]|nr:anti-sigma factor antagonist [Hespellia sp.]